MLNKPGPTIKPTAMYPEILGINRIKRVISPPISPSNKINPKNARGLICVEKFDRKFMFCP